MRSQAGTAVPVCGQYVLNSCDLCVFRHWKFLFDVVLQKYAHFIEPLSIGGLMGKEGIMNGFPVGFDLLICVGQILPKGVDTPVILLQQLVCQLRAQKARGTGQKYGFVHLVHPSKQ